MLRLVSRTIAVLTLGLACTACGGGDDGGPAGDSDAAVDDVPDGVVDVRVPVPAADPGYFDIVTPEIQIAPGEERMYCYYLDNSGGDFAVSTLKALQGKYGHHVVLLTTIEPKPAGTFEDCTSQEDMWKFRSFVLPVELPDGYGIKVPSGLQYVMQIHYVNTGEAPILVRDVARLRRIDTASVSTWVATLTTNSLRLALPPGTSTEQFDCTIDEDAELLLLGGHMHELGSRFKIEVGPSENELQNLYLVDPWHTEFRDAPPVTLFFSAPRQVSKGTIIRTTCEWLNTGSTTVKFPSEMCSSFGYLAGTDKPIHCEPAAN